MATEHGAPTIPLDRMRWREKIDEVKRAGVSVAQCIKTELDQHSGSISHDTWIDTIEPLKHNFNMLEEVMISLVQDIEREPSIDLGARPGETAPQDPPAEDPPAQQDPPPLDPAELEKGYTPPPADGDGQE